MNSVFLLWHSHDLGDGDSDDKLIGVYRSRAGAEAAMARARPLPGFEDYPDDFIIDEHTLDQDGWREGYVTVYPCSTEGHEATEEPLGGPRRPND